MNCNQANARAKAREAEALRLQGLSIGQIAQYLGITKRAVLYRLAKARELNKEIPQVIDGEEKLGECISRLELLERQAYAKFMEAPEGTPIQVGFLRLAGGLRLKLAEFYLKTGVIQEITPKGFDDLDFSPEEKDLWDQYEEFLIKARNIKINKGVKLLVH